MALELLRECLKLIDFKSERSRLSGEFRLGVEDDNDLNRDDSARWRAALDEFRPYSGDQATTNVFPDVQAIVFEGQHLCCRIRNSWIFSNWISRNYTKSRNTFIYVFTELIHVMENLRMKILRP